MIRKSPMALTCGRPRAAPLAVRGAENLALHFLLFCETALVGVWEAFVPTASRGGCCRCNVPAPILP